MKVTKNIFVRFRTIEGEGYLVNRNSVYKLNELASRIWSMLDDHEELEDIVNELSETFIDVERNIIAKDTKSFIKELNEKEMVEVSA